MNNLSIRACKFLVEEQIKKGSYGFSCPTYSDYCSDISWDEVMKELCLEKPKKFGRWIDEGQYADGHSLHAFRCSECGGHIIASVCQVYDGNPYCRWCGTKMGEEDGN